MISPGQFSMITACQIEPHYLAAKLLSKPHMLGIPFHLPVRREFQPQGSRRFPVDYLRHEFSMITAVKIAPHYLARAPREPMRIVCGVFQL
ncbi:MAG: hypothetical protein LBW85_08970 [Deltaproteobacteria bacterium]|jgi:hypothetical protein|nr:hypothetical protein [Deltaproteobacteria bacterium]